jgi:phage repressor protein C with HTH and peptisase S24 domain
MTKKIKGGFFDDSGFPVGASWDEIDAPGVVDPNAYALEIAGDSMLPVYREGDIVIVSPSSPVRNGDRVIAKTKDGQVMARVLNRQTERKVELALFDTNAVPQSYDMKEIDWIARILWASQ